MCNWIFSRALCVFNTGFAGKEKKKLKYEATAAVLSVFYLVCFTCLFLEVYLGFSVVLIQKISDFFAF